MPLRTLFRVIVVLYPVLVAAAIAYQQLSEPYLSEDWRNILAWNGDGGWAPSDFAEGLTSASAIGWGILIITFVVVLFAVQVGLFCFRRWARTGFVALTLLLVVTVPFLGLSIYLPLDAAITELISISDGLIIALAYFSPLRREFAKARSA